MFVNMLFNCELNGLTEKKPTLVIGFAGDPETVRWQINFAQTLLQQTDNISVQKN